MHFRKSHVRASKLEVKETSFSFTQFTEAEIISLDAWNSRCRSLGLGD